METGSGPGMDLAEHAACRLLGTGDLSIVAGRDPYAARVQAQVRIWTPEAAMRTWAGPS